MGWQSSGAVKSVSLAQLVSSFIYYPESDWIVTPGRLGLRAEEVQLEPEPGIQLHAWFFPVSNSLASLLFCHGNAGNVSHRLENVASLVQTGFQVLLFDYRGYGHSSGQPSEKGLYRDAIAAWEYLLGRKDSIERPLIIFGRSLGGAVAIDLANHIGTPDPNVSTGLVIESTFTSIQTLARLIFRLALPNLPVKYDSLSKIGRIRMPLLAIHGEQDELIPYADGQALFKAAPEPKAWYPIPGAGHNDTYLVGGKTYFQRLASFARDLARSQT
jgi:fermentation-respiration switch protein FrsA (DUF1100 family)